MIRFRAEPPAEKPEENATAKPEKAAKKIKAAKSSAKEDMLDLAAEAQDDKD